MSDKISLRQVGREIPGRVYKGPVTDAYNRISHPSVPSKFELVLNRSNPSRKGFGTTSNRFRMVTNPNPGPGQYSGENKEEQPSHSVKGYGGLISHSTRFRKFQYNTPVPGPGSYNTKTLQSSKSVSSVFIEGATKSLAQNTNNPAPGQYNPVYPRKTAGITSTFKSNTKRIPKTTENFEKPAPWQYDPKVSLTRTNSAQLTSAFKLSQNTRKPQMNLYDPHQQMPQETLPGPGTYEQANAASKELRPSSMFAKTNMSRFGQGEFYKNNLNPGPGQYANQQSQDKIPVSGAVFMSETERNWVNIERKPPGPAFYKPMSVPKKRSFHLNSNKKWI